MSEKEATEQQIEDTLNKIMDTDGIFENPSHTIKFLTKIIFNLRYDLNEMKLELLKVFKPEGEEKTMEEVNGSFYT